MGIKDFLEGVLLIALPEQPQRGIELEEATKILSEEVHRDVVVDFSEVQALTSETLCGLMILNRLLEGFGRLLVLCNVSTEIKHVFIRTGLVTVFEFEKDELAALQRIRSVSHLPA